jgi:predicted AlkP superfamily phosphohydrolase/phosphomutase
MSSEKASPLVMIALDAAEPSLVEQWMEEGILPNLEQLRARGAYGRLATSAEWLAGSPWPTFYTGTTPADHGVYHFMQWYADRMNYARPRPDWLRTSPFWRGLGSNGRHVVAIDLPMTYAPESFNGVEISGWATHDMLSPPASYPEKTMDWVHEQFGRSPLREEVLGPQTPKALLLLRDELVRVTGLVADLAAALMNREAWDLFIVGFGATHRGGHKLWSLAGVEGPVDEDQRLELSNALRSVYAACDAAIGKLIEVSGNANILVFSLHGMGPNTDRSNLVPIMLSRILDERAETTKSSRPGLLRRVRELVPVEWRSRAKGLLPPALQDRLTLFWRKPGIQWNRMPAFSLMSDLQGYIRINLRGREAAGIVEPGEEYDRLCDRIAQGLLTFVDADTGKPVVDRVLRIDELYPEGARRNHLPDLIVRWADTPVAAHRALVSPLYGTIEWPTPGLNPDGRSGNHRPQGFFIAAGEGVRQGSPGEGAHIMDLAPTVYALLRVAQPPEMRGKVLPLTTANNS